MSQPELPRETIMTSVISTSEKRSRNEIAIHGTTAGNKSVFASATLLSDDISTTSKSTMPEAPNVFTNAHPPSLADASKFRRHCDMPPEANQDSDLTADVVKCLSSHGSPELKAIIRAIGSRQSVSTYGATKPRDKSRGRISRQSKMITLLQKNISALEAEQQRSNSVIKLLKTELKAEKEERQARMSPSSESGSGITITLDGSAADTIVIKRRSQEIEILGEKKNKKKPGRAQHRQQQVVLASRVKKPGKLSKNPPPTRPPKKGTQKPGTKRKHPANNQQEQRKRKAILPASQAKAPTDALASASSGAPVEIPRAGDKRKYPADAGQDSERKRRRLGPSVDDIVGELQSLRLAPAKRRCRRRRGGAKRRCQ